METFVEEMVEALVAVGRRAEEEEKKQRCKTRTNLYLTFHRIKDLSVQLKHICRPVNNAVHNILDVLTFTSPWGRCSWPPLGE